MRRRSGAAPGEIARRGRRCPCWRRGSAPPARPRAAPASRAAIASAPSLLKPKRLIAARSSVSRNRRGRGLPGCGRGVAAPTSRKPKPARISGASATAFLSKPAARPTGLGSASPASRVASRGERHRPRQRRRPPKAAERRAPPAPAAMRRRSGSSRCGSAGAAPGRSAAQRQRLEFRARRVHVRLARQSGEAVRHRLGPSGAARPGESAARAAGRDAGRARRRATAPISAHRARRPRSPPAGQLAGLGEVLGRGRRPPARRWRNGCSRRRGRPARPRSRPRSPASAHSGGAENLVDQHCAPS